MVFEGRDEMQRERHRGDTCSNWACSQSLRRRKRTSWAKETCSIQKRRKTHRGSEALIVACVFKEDRETVAGIGFKQLNGSVTVSRIAEDGLFSRTDLKVGDEIVSINGIECAEMTNVEAANLIIEAEGPISIVAMGWTFPDIPWGDDKDTGEGKGTGSRQFAFTDVSTSKARSSDKGETEEFGDLFKSSVHRPLHTDLISLGEPSLQSDRTQKSSERTQRVRTGPGLLLDNDNSNCSKRNDISFRRQEVCSRQEPLYSELSPSAKANDTCFRNSTVKSVEHPSQTDFSGQINTDWESFSVRPCDDRTASRRGTQNPFRNNNVASTFCPHEAEMSKKGDTQLFGDLFKSRINRNRQNTDLISLGDQSRRSGELFVENSQSPFARRERRNTANLEQLVDTSPKPFRFKSPSGATGGDFQFKLPKPKITTFGSRNLTANSTKLKRGRIGMISSIDETCNVEASTIELSHQESSVATGSTQCTVRVVEEKMMPFGNCEKQETNEVVVVTHTFDSSVDGTVQSAPTLEHGRKRKASKRDTARNGSGRSEPLPCYTPDSSIKVESKKKKQRNHNVVPPLSPGRSRPWREGPGFATFKEQRDDKHRKGFNRKPWHSQRVSPNGTGRRSRQTEAYHLLGEHNEAQPPWNTKSMFEPASPNTDKGLLDELSIPSLVKVQDGIQHSEEVSCVTYESGYNSLISRESQNRDPTARESQSNEPVTGAPQKASVFGDFDSALKDLFMVGCRIDEDKTESSTWF